MEKKTALFDVHTALNGRMVDFAGYLLPIQYESILAEHNATRQSAGIFDVSHMGELVLSGTDALATLQNLLTRDISGLAAGKIAYSPLCNEDGGVIDDVLVYKLADGRFLLVVNAANMEKDADWVNSHLTGNTKMENISCNVSQIALQGPKSAAILRKFTNGIPDKYYTFIENAVIDGKSALISRTGYTGEDGFEIYLKNEDAPGIFMALKNAGATPCGLGARDTLRLEAAMPLYGHEMDETVPPYEANIGYFVNADKKDFIGKNALLQKKDDAHKLVGLKILDRGIARPEAEVMHNGKPIGTITSGTQSPTLGYPIALARVAPPFPQPGDVLAVSQRGRELRAEVVPLPFYKRKSD
ncbi:MAG: glycine cleavage system aminomethyltransferase GcvT [Christensenellaceae bacterium]